MDEKIREQLEQLRADHQTCQTELQALQAKTNEYIQHLLKVEGAIQVLEGLLAEAE